MNNVNRLNFHLDSMLLRVENLFEYHKEDMGHYVKEKMDINFSKKKSKLK